MPHVGELFMRSRIESLVVSVCALLFFCVGVGIRMVASFFFFLEVIERIYVLEDLM